jgi:hypothetical protein
MDVRIGEVVLEVGCGVPKLAFALSAASLAPVICTDLGTVPGAVCVFVYVFMCLCICICVYRILLNLTHQSKHVYHLKSLSVVIISL